MIQPNVIIDKTELTISNSGLSRQLEEDKQYVTNDINNAIENRARLLANLPVLQARERAARMCANLVDEEGFSDEVAQDYRDNLREWREQLAISESREATLQSSLTALASRLSVIQRQLDENAAVPATTVRRDEIKRELQNIANVTDVVLREEGGRQSVLIELSDVKMRPQSNPYLWINQGEIPTIKLQPLILNLRLDSPCITINPADDSSTYPIGMSSDGQAHPHIVDALGSPCLGDFGGPLFEALDMRDWASIVAVATLFLETAVTGDSAGKYWPRWLLPVSRRPGYDNYRCVGRNANEYRFIETDDNGNVTEWFNTSGRWNDQKPGTPQPTAVVVEEISAETIPRVHMPDIEIDIERSVATLTVPHVHMPDIDDDYDSEGYDSEGYNEYGYDRDGYDAEGYNRDGYDEDGYNRAGYNRDGYDSEGYDRAGYDVHGFNADGYNSDGYDEYGYDGDGYNDAGYNREGYDRNGYNEDGFDHSGWDRHGFDDEGFNAVGFDRRGFNADGIDHEGYDRAGLHTITGLTREQMANV